jgi:catechol 2,3-dioxygenase-like lactoylglutathione lyase family enzyme
MGEIEGARFGHVNVTGPDWRVLADFYRDVFGCELVPPERDYRSADLDAATNLAGAHLTGAHLRLPGHGPTGPTIEIYQYDEMVEDSAPQVNRPGWGHIAFQVPDVEAALEAVVAHGGARFGAVVTLQTSDGRRVTWCYARDPAANLVELQAWSEAAK